MGERRIAVSRISGEVRDIVAAASTGVCDNGDARRHKIAARREGNVNALDGVRGLQGHRYRLQRVIVRDNELGLIAAVVVVADHARRPSTDRLKQAAYGIA